MLVNFCKMQSLGNDFIMIDLTQFHGDLEISAEFFKRISDRHFGIGCDLVVLYEIVDTREGVSTVEVRFFNSDGSEAEICGNATKCIGLLMHHLKKTDKCVMFAGEKKFKIEIEGEKEVSVYWDKAINIESFDISKISSEDFSYRAEKLKIEKAFRVNVGNPHLVLFVEDYLSDDAIKEIGRKLESNPTFPNKTNVEFAKKNSEGSIGLVVFERGAGLTLACGSGALAAAVAAKTDGIVSETRVVVHQKGGDLSIDFFNDGSYKQTSSADYIFSGNIELPVSGFCPMPHNNKIIIYTDGACSGNPGLGGWGAIIIDDGKTVELSGGEIHTTNNRMELTAVIKALESVSEKHEIELYTDSQYVKNGITQWISNWVKNSWKNSENKPVKNQDLWKQLLEVSKQRKIYWKWVRGHNGDKFNEQVDALARKAYS